MKKFPRLTGFNTPIFGLEWEYPEETGVMRHNNRASFRFNANRKISVFISSICDKNHQKYLEVRKELCDKLEATGLFSVYLFERDGASTLSAGSRYVLSEHIDSDVVIFLIDNADGIPNGVQKEIDIARKHKMKTLFYFCTENSAEETVAQKQQTGIEASKYREVNKFEDLSEQGFCDLVNDILNVYRYYCKNQLVAADDIEEENPVGGSILLEESDCYISKAVLRNLPQTRDMLLNEAIGEKCFWL